MRTILLAAAGAVAAIATTASAQSEAQAPPAAVCYIEIQRLLAEPPSGIGDLGAAIRELDAALRPQVEAINVLRAQIARIERQLQEREAAAEPADAVGSFELERVALAPEPSDNPVAEELMRLEAELGTRQDQLKLDYAAQQTAIVGPVQTRVSQRAQAFAAERGCSEIKMARAPDLAALQAAAARDVTGDFVTWYALDKS